MNVNSIEKTLTQAEYEAFRGWCIQRPTLSVDEICRRVWGLREGVELSRSAIARQIKAIRFDHAQLERANRQLALFREQGEDPAQLNELMASFGLQTLLKDFAAVAPEFSLEEQARCIDTLTRVYRVFALIRQAERKADLEELKLTLDDSRAELEARRVALLEAELERKRAAEAEAKAKLAALQQEAQTTKTLDPETLHRISRELFGLE